MEELERTVKMPLDPLRIFMQQYGDLAGAGVRHKASSKNNFENTTKQRPPASISLGRTLHARPSGHGLGGYGAGGVAVAMAAVEEQREAGQDEIYEDEYGGGMLSVGVADDPNPRFRSAMEDAYAIELGFGERRSLGRTGKLHSTGAGGGIHSVMKAPSDSGRKQATVHARSSANFDITHSSYGMSTTQSSIMPMANARGGFFAIYDGHGGRECADFAREHLHRELDKALRSHVESQKALEKAFLITDEKIRESGRFDECGSTAVVAYVHVDEREGRDLFLANVGDAQAFLVAEVTVADGSRRLLPVPLSYNHVATDAREVRRVREVGGSVMLGRVAGVLAVTRALGDHAYKRGGGLSAVPYQTHCRLGPQHKYLMMGCDGVWDVVQPEEAVAELEGLTDPEEMAQKLVRFPYCVRPSLFCLLMTQEATFPLLDCLRQIFHELPYKSGGALTSEGHYGQHHCSHRPLLMTLGSPRWRHRVRVVIEFAGQWSLRKGKCRN
jgi:serine/threonine protein phosphatase PrpC